VMLRQVLLVAVVAIFQGADAYNQHLVMFREGLMGSDRAAHSTFLAPLLSSAMVNVTDTFAIGDFSGYSANIDGEATLAAIRGRPEVAVVEWDIPLRLKSAATCDIQKDVPSWGLARVSETKLPLKGTYAYPDKLGSNADIYVLDTGVRVTHKDFGGRAKFGFNAAGGKIDTDKDGHGTMVAGITAADKYGICRQCQVISVKVFKDNGDCDASILIKAFNWVAKNLNKARKSVINISVGGDPGQTSDTMDAAVNALVKLGVHVVGAAGNENVDACTESPGRASGILAVGSSMILTDTLDFFLGGSNFGKCVSLFAPGDKIVSLGSSSDTAVSQPDSGTSFSSPHVAGVLAELAAANPEASLEEVQGMLLNNTLNGVIDGVPKGTANKLLHKACKGSN